MKIVIELPADDFNAIYHGGLYAIQHDKLDQVITEAFQTATIIPKGHGDLIDRSKLAYYRCPNNVKDCPPEYDFTCQNCDFGVISRFRVDAAPVIIPADKE
jgi:hypothetical protein